MKRMILLLALCLLLPVLALADCPVTITGKNASGAYNWDEDTRTLTIQADGLTVSGGDSGDDYKIVVESGVKTLTLSTYVRPRNGSALTVNGDLTLNISYKGQNIAIRNHDLGVPVIWIKPGRTLTVTSDANVEVGFIYGNSQEEIEKGANAIVGNLTYAGIETMKVNGGTGAKQGGVGVKGHVSVSGTGTLYVYGGSGATRGGDGIVGDVSISGGGSLCATGSNSNKGAQGYGGNGIVGRVTVNGGYLSAYGGTGTTQAGVGIVLTGDSAISGGDDWDNASDLHVYGDHDYGNGKPAIRRENGAVLTISGAVRVELIGGGKLWFDDLTPRPDYEQGQAPALSDAGLLSWGSPLQLVSAERLSADMYSDFEFAVSPRDLEGKGVIRSGKGWRVTYDASGGAGEMKPAIVPDGLPYTIETECGFTRENHEFLGWEVIMGGQKVKYEPKITINADTTIRAVWKRIGGADSLPETGDDTNIALMLALLSASLGGAAWMMRRKRA